MSTVTAGEQIWGEPARQAISRMKGDATEPVWGTPVTELFKQELAERLNRKYGYQAMKSYLHHMADVLETESHSSEDLGMWLNKYNDEYADNPSQLRKYIPDLVKIVCDHRTAATNEDKQRMPPRPPNPEHWQELFHSYEEIANAPPLTFAINGWLQAEGITMYGGLPGHGKTLLGLSTTKALLTGEPLFGYDYFKVERGKRVLYLCPEVGRGPLSQRIKMFKLLPFVKSGELCIRSLSAPDVPLMDKRILKAAEGADVFLDTAVRFMEGEENSATEQRVFAKNLFTLLSAGARTVVGLHHSPKFSKRADTMNLENALRGTNELGAMLSTAWGTKLVDQDTTRLYVQNLKPRDFDPVGAFTLEGRPHIDLTGDFKMVDQPGTAGELKDHQSTRGLVDPDAGKEILRLKAEGKTIREIADEIKLSRSVVGRFVKDRTAVPLSRDIPRPAHNKPDEPNS